MATLTPKHFAPHSQPSVEFSKAAKELLPRIVPYTTATILYVLLYNAFLPTRGDIAEIRVKQVMCRHGIKARIDNTPFATQDFIHGSLHVVVDATAGNATHGCERACMCIKQHFMTLSGVGD